MKSKRELKEKIESPSKLRKQMERRCFWTWPLGHIWIVESEGFSECANCKKWICTS